MSEMQPQLQQAYQLIQEENDDAALAILRPIVSADPSNADAWWLITYATDDPTEARRALVHVLKASPDNAEARTNLTQLNEIAPPTPEEQSLLATIPPASKSSKSAALDDLFQDEFTDEEDLFADVLAEKDAKREAVEEDKGGLGFVAQAFLAVVTVIMAVVLGTVLLNEQEGDAGQTDLAALEAGNVVDSLANLDLGTGNTSVFANTDLGNTLFVQSCVCTTADCAGSTPTQLPEMALNNLQLAAAQVANANAQADMPGVGVEITACDNADDTLYRAYAATDTVSNAPELDWATLQDNWTIES